MIKERPLLQKQSLIDRLHTWNKARLKKRRAARQGAYAHKLAVLGIMKNGSLNIDEWIHHYLSMGAEKIFLIDNGSTDDTVAKAQKWMADGRVSLLIRSTPHRQRRHYWDAIKTFKIRKSCEWLIIADLDEFWFCPDGQPIAEKLNQEQFSFTKFIYGNWRQFGSSGFTDHPNSIRTDLIMAAPELGSHTTRKFMCRTNVLKSIFSFNLYHINGAPSRSVVSDNHNFQLNHYQIQSRSYFETSKMQRGDAVHRNLNRMRDWDYFDRYDAPCTVKDRKLSDLITSGKLPPLERR